MRLFLLLAFSVCCHGYAQIPEVVIMPSIKSVKLFPLGNQVGYPIIRLGSSDQLELHFDDLDADVKNLSYTFQLCNYDWTPAMLSHFDFIKGFSQVRISTYRISSVAYTRYTHYTANLPDKNCFPSRSGNYILKVFKNSDTAQLLFTRRFLVVESLATIGAVIQQPYSGRILRTHQKVNFKVSLEERLDVVNFQQQVKVAIIQNMRWDNAITTIKPTFFSRRVLEYNTENDAVFPAGKEWRWLDLRSLRLQSDRVADARYGSNSTDIFVRPDLDRVSQKFNFYRDANGRYYNATTERLNPLWQTDYATVHFSFIPQGGAPFPDKDVFIFGELSDYDLRDQAKMQFNTEKGAYETTLFLKQGYYDYMYVTVDRNDMARKGNFEFTEGNLWESENEYMILVYFLPLGGRADQLIGFAKVNSLPIN